MSNSALKQKAVSATFWSGIDTFARQGLQFIVSLILARLLSPQDYGTIGLLAIFVGLAGVFVDSGFSTALIQREHISDIELSSVFYFNLGVSLVAAALLCVFAPWIAEFYSMPILRAVTWVLAANLVIGSLGSIQQVLLTKALDFRRQCMISLVAQLVSGAVAILLAWHHFAVWSLCIQTLLATTIGTLLLWGSSSWRPGRRFSIAAIQSLFRFGSFLFLSALLDTLFGRLNTLIIGKFYSAKDLGYYSRADSARGLPASLISTIISRVAFPLFSAAKENVVLLRAGLRKAITLAMMINIPLSIGITVTARPLVLVLFGEPWLPCVPYLQVLSIAVVLWPLQVLNLNILSAQGHSNLFFRLELIKKAIGILVISISAPFGILAMAWGSVFFGIFSFGINAYYSGRFVGYGAFRQIIDLLPYIGATLVMVLAVMAANQLPLTSPFLQLLTQVFVGVVAYVSICAGFRLAGFFEAWNLILSLFAKRHSPVTGE